MYFPHPHPHPIALKVNKSTAVFVLIRGLDDLLRQSRGSVIMLFITLLLSLVELQTDKVSGKSKITLLTSSLDI